MDRKIPIYFDSVVVSSPLEKISENNPDIGRVRVRAFTKYGNRNGSYITDAVSEQLIHSAIRGNVPVIGFFDPQSQSWSSHTGPTLANAYGYIESFVGWEPYLDTDGVTRDYAVFTVILFTKYFEEAQKILGQNQSMELDINSITGDWADINGIEYYVYKTAEMLGFCIIGDHEPCFSVSAFFSKNDDTYNTQYEKFSSLLFDLKTQVEEAKKNNEGGEQPMNEFENQTVVTEEVVDPQTEEVQETVENFESEAENTAEVVEETVETQVETFEETPVEESQEVETEPSEFEALQTQFNELQESYNQLQENLNTAQARIEELEAFQNTANTELETLRATNQELQTSLQSYEAEAQAVENSRKNELVKKYEKILNEEEINPIKDKINDFSYDELESKLAITFANKQMTGGEVKKVPLPDPEQTQFALFMEKYRKN